MALDLLQTILDSHVTDVTDVQPCNHGASGCNVSKSAAVTGVTPPASQADPVTSVTADVTQTLQPKPLPIGACTSVTAVTSEKTKACSATGQEPEPAPVRTWHVRFSDRPAITVTVVPYATREEVAHQYPRAVSVEPWQPADVAPSAPMTGGELAKVRAWLAYIHEGDPNAIAEVLRRCEESAGAREYFMRRGDEAEAALMADVAALARAALIEPPAEIPHGRMVGEDG